MLNPYVLDKAAILERLGGDEDIFAMMVEMFLQDAEGNCAALAAAQSSGLAASLQREAHTVKGLLATFSDAEGAAIASALEQKAKQGLLEGSEAAVSLIHQRVQEIMGVLRGLS